MDTFDAFVLEHEGDDTARLLLGRDKYPGIDLDLAVNTIEARRRLRAKVPEWYALPSLVYPTRLCAEQCSSTPTARYKALFAARAGEGMLIPLHAMPPGARCPKSGVIRHGNQPSAALQGPDGTNDGTYGLDDGTYGQAQAYGQADNNRQECRLGKPGTRIADLTGGLGVDAWAFSEMFGEVLYNEADERLCDAARHNFAALGLTNVKVQNRMVEPGKVREILGGFQPDVIYLDPARRAEDGRKVFLLEDCRPDVKALLPELLEAAPGVLLKLSPMADITMVLQRLSHVREVHVVASGGECKELLLLLERGYTGGHSITAVEDGTRLSWTPEEEAAAALRLPASAQLPRRLFEPGKALAKAGAFRLPCARFGLTKLGVHTHLYVADTLPEALEPFGKCFDIQEVMPLDKRTLKEARKRWPRAEVTARNLPLGSDELRRRIGCASGGDVHLFGVRIDLPEGPANFLIAARKSE